jgi:hypothetical protein
MLAVALAVAAGSALAQDIKVGVTLSATGPAASLGIPERNTVRCFGRRSAAARSSTSSSTMRPTRRPPSRMHAS